MSTTFHSASKKPKASRRKRPSKGSQLVIVGNGMVGCKLCEQLVTTGLHQHYEITVIGAEPRPAYDRINLSSYVESRNGDELVLRPASWYEENNITLLTGTKVSKIERELKTLTLEDEKKVNYETLILATGSRPFAPPIEGSDHPNVFLYRTIEDLEAISIATQRKSSATIIGGGLLGLEAAQAVQKLGLKATVVERASFLMPRQLNDTAAGLLQAKVAEQEIDLLLSKTTTGIVEKESQLTLGFEDGSSVTSDLIIISAGITPNSELAKDAELAVGIRGGIVVDEQLETEDPNIFAIGECALFDGRIYGLAAPGYAMARHVAERLTGKKTDPFPHPDLSTRLKMLGVDVVTIGESLEEGRRLEFEGEDLYRMLILSPRGDIKGGLGVGAWPEAGKIQSLFATGQRLTEKEQNYFLKEGVIIPGGGSTPVAQWPDDRIVCNCMGISKGELSACLTKCKRDPVLLAAETSASTVCGSCGPLLDELCDAPPTATKPVGARMLLIASAIALLAVLATIFAPPMKMADSVESWWYQVDKFWRDPVVKQITGFSLMGIFVVGLLISLRKRFKWFRFGHFNHWRVFHALFGVTSLVALFFHTGFRFGHNLNFWLMFTFVALNLLGAVAGVVAAVESTGTSQAALAARRFRPALTYAHLVLFWPLPVLLTFHILSVYLY